MRKGTPAVLAVLALAAPAGAAAKVKAPNGSYAGPRDLVMQVSGKTIDLLAFDFPCKRHPKGHGRTSLNSIPLRKSSEGYKFSIKLHGIVTYSDEHVDENGFTAISGQFGRRGRTAKGRFMESTRHCGKTGKLKWSAERVQDAR